MCGIIGLRCKDEEISSAIIEELLLQSQIRGRHSTGIAFYNNSGKIETDVRPIPADKFVGIAEFPESEFKLGHVRYSTSNLKYNQPLSNDNIAITHNGVITQEDPKNWKKHYNFSDFETANDSELLLKCLSSDNMFVRKLLFSKFEGASISCGVLEKGRMWCFRNTTRPLWLFESKWDEEDSNIPLFSGFASTEDIIKRTFSKLGLPVVIEETQPFMKYLFTSEGIIKKVEMTSNISPDHKIEQQRSTKIESKYLDNERLQKTKRTKKRTV